MNVVKQERVRDGVCSEKDAVTFGLNDQERIKVQNALDVIELLKTKAMRALKKTERNGDFTSYRFSVGGNTVTVYVEQGMVG